MGMGTRGKNPKKKKTSSAAKVLKEEEGEEEDKALKFIKDASVVLSLAGVFIDSECRRLADEALRKKDVVASTSCSKSKEEIKESFVKVTDQILSGRTLRSRSKSGGDNPQDKDKSVYDLRTNDKPSAELIPNNKYKESTPSKTSTDYSSSPSSTPRARVTRRRKALTKALQKLRNHPIRRIKKLSKDKPEPKSKQSYVPSTSDSKSVVLRNLRPRKCGKSITGSKNQKRSSTFIKKMNNSNPNEESCKNPPVEPESQEKIPDPEDEQNHEGEDKTQDPASDSSSDDVKIPILEKPIPSDKDDDSDEDASLTLPDDSDYESSLLSPSALPISSLFKSPSSSRKKAQAEGDAKVSRPARDLPLKLSSPPAHSSPKPSTSTSAHRPTQFLQIPHSSRTTFPNSSPSLSSTSSSSLGGFFLQTPTLPEKRGRGRPRKPLEDIKSISGKLYRRKLAERLNSNENPGADDTSSHNQLYPPHQNYSPSASEPIMSMSTASSGDGLVVASTSQPHSHSLPSSPQKRIPPASPSSDPLNFRKRLQRWKDRSTFVYAKHKFVTNKENKFRCDTCDVSFTALSSLKRHYGTIYHKQQLGELDTPSPVPGPSTSPTSSLNSQPRRVGSATGNRSASVGPPRTQSFVRRNAVDNIKKYYAAADAARRNKAAGGGGAGNYPSSSGVSFASTWLHQKQQRKRKPLQHSDFLYPSSSADSEGEEDRFGRSMEMDFHYDNLDDDNIENSFPGGNEDENYILPDKHPDEKQKTWLSSAWKGIGNPHFTCEVCGESFEKKRAFTEHLFVHRKEDEKHQTLTCEDCQISHINENMLSNHYKLFNHGPQSNGSSGGKMRFICFECGSKFSQREYFRKHHETHKRPPIKCPHCPEKFFYKFYLSDHIKAEHDGWSYSNGNGTGLVGGTGFGNTSTGTLASNLGGVAKGGKKMEVFSKTTTFISEENNGQIRRKTSATSEEGGKKRGGGKGKELKSSSSNFNTNSCSTGGPAEPDEDLLEMTIMQGTVEMEDSNEKYFNEETGTTSDRPKERINLLQRFLDSQKEQSGSVVEESHREGGESEKSTEGQSNAELKAVERSTTEDGKIVFHFEPLSTEHSLFEGYDPKGNGKGGGATISPLTIEIPRDNINMGVEGEMKREGQGNEEGYNVADESEVKQVSTNESCEIQGDNKKVGVTGSSSSSLLNLTLIGCGVKWASQTKPEENPLTCQDCGKVFEHRKSLVKHVFYYKQSEDYPCKLCNKTFKLKHHVSRHMKSFHNVDTNSTTSSTTSEDQGEVDFLSSPTGSGSSGLLSIPPPLSESATSSGIGLDGKITKSALLSSPISRRSSTTKIASLAKVKVSRSSSVSTPSTNVTPSSSGSCVKSYTTVLDDKGTTIFKCLICFKLYPTKPQLNSHLWYHNKRNAAAAAKSEAPPPSKGKFYCDHCPGEKCFSWRKDLLRHKREKHGIFGKKGGSEEEPIPSGSGKAIKENQPSPKRCSHCPMVFPEENDLEEHISQEHKDDEDKKGKNVEDEDDDDMPPTPSPHTSPIPIIHRQDDQEDLEEEEDEDDTQEGEPSSPEFELLELN